mgnify:CR=1 FL=1
MIWHKISIYQEIRDLMIRMDSANARLMRLESQAFDLVKSGRLEEARVSAEKEKDVLIEEARKSAGVIVETARREIETQKAEAVRELRGKVAGLAVLAAERILLKQLDHRANTDLASKDRAEIEKEKPELKLGNN